MGMLAKIRRMRFRDKVSLREITRTHLINDPDPFYFLLFSLYLSCGRR